MAFMKTLLGEKLSQFTKPKLGIKQIQKKIHKKRQLFQFSKRQKFVTGVVILSSLLFLAEFIPQIRLSQSGIIISIGLGLLANLFLFWALFDEYKEHTVSPTVFILAFFYSLAFGLFYFLIPARIIARLLLSFVYAFGLYSLYLSQNIFVVASIRTIQLLSGARIVSFVITLISYFFLTNIVFTLHGSLTLTIILIAALTVPLVFHSLWTYTLQRIDLSLILWALGLALCLTQLGGIIWFWPSAPTVLALFLTGFFYVMVGLSHIWLEKRLFRNILWEYAWVGVIVFFMLLLFSSWGK